MADSPRFVVAAPDVYTADVVLGTLPEGVSVRVLLLGCDTQAVERDVASLPVDGVEVVPDTEFSAPPDRLGPALQQVLDEADVLALDSSQPARDLAGWAVSTLGASLVWAVNEVRTHPASLEVDRVTLGGSHKLVHAVEAPGLAVLLTRGERPLSARQRTTSRPAVATLYLEPPMSRTRVVKRALSPNNGLAPLQGARIVVSVGRGIGGAHNVPLFRELAETLGAALGASRVAVDSGWLPFSHQVGQTGAAIAPDLYLAFGISGQIQHLAGMRTSSRIVAINIDEEAPICSMADLVVKADASRFAQVLLDSLRANSGEVQLARV